jgi:monothiol glutaredoxin
MTRNVLPESSVRNAIRAKIDALHSNIVEEVKTAIASNAIVVVGMGMNPIFKHVNGCSRRLGNTYCQRRT